MSETGSLRVWIVAKPGVASVDALAEGLGAAGYECTTLAPGQVARHLVQEAGGELIDSIRGLLKGIRDGDPAPESEHAHQPHVVIVMTPKLFGATAAFARLTTNDVLRIGLVPDYALGRAWVDAPLHAWVVPVEAFVQPLVESGVDEHRVAVAGPPVPPDYAEAVQADALREEWGFTEAPVVLVHCDHADWDLDRLAFQFSLLDAQVLPIFYTGGHAAVSDALRRGARKHGVEADMLGQVPSLRDFHAVADIVVMPADDPRVVDVLGLDRPVLLVGEADVRTQVEFLTGAGAARHVPDVLRLGTELDLVCREDVLAALKQGAATIGKTDGTQTAVAAVIRLIEQREAMLSAQERAPESRRGPFERIGAPTKAIRLPGAPAGRPTSSASTAEAKDELANLIMLEREAERKVTEAQRAVEQWGQRLELANEWNEVELAKEAQAHADRAQAEYKAAVESLERTRIQKEKLKESVRRGRGDAIAPPNPGGAQFEDMEVERDLDALRKRLKDELD